MVKLAGIKYESFVDASGVSCVLFFSGCLHNCCGCQSPQTHDFNYGIEITDGVIDSINEEIKKRPFLSALVLSGGDPMYSPLDVLHIIDRIDIPNNQVWCYTGFTIEEIMQDSRKIKLLKRCSVLVDGPYIDSLRDITLPFRGSTNQRLIDVQKSLSEGTIVLYDTN